LPSQITFGELAACAAVASLILEYVSGMALVARGFSTYLARLCNLPADYFRVGPQTVGGGQFDVRRALRPAARPTPACPPRCCLVSCRKAVRVCDS
jgi:hypothetical protein